MVVMPTRIFSMKVYRQLGNFKPICFPGQLYRLYSRAGGGVCGRGQEDASRENETTGAGWNSLTLCIVDS